MLYLNLNHHAVVYNLVVCIPFRTSRFSLCQSKIIYYSMPASL
jgi:hypothetical protein